MDYFSTVSKPHVVRLSSPRDNFLSQDNSIRITTPQDFGSEEFLTFRWSGSVPAVRKEKRMYFDAKEFGKRLHDVRTSRGITQEELAVRLGLANKQHVSRMENGERSCSIDLLIELSCILHVSTDYLLMGSESSKEEIKNDLLSIISELSLAVPMIE